MTKQENWENFEKTGKISYYLAMKEEEQTEKSNLEGYAPMPNELR